MRKYSGFAGKTAETPPPRLVGRFGAAAALTTLLLACASEPPLPAAPAALPAEPAIPVAETESEPAPAPPARVVLRDSGSGRYIVKKGDTLWDIASYFLRDPWQWPELWYVNHQVANPHLIYPGDVLTISWIDGQPRLVREHSLALERLSPRVREIDLGEAVPAIPLDAIRNFLRGPRIVSSEQLEQSPYVLAFLDDRLLAGAGDEVYVRNLVDSDIYAYTVIEVGKPYRDPDDGTMLGYEAIPTAEAEVRDAAPTSVAELISTYRETRIGNRLLVREAEIFASSFYPHAPTLPVNGTIISVFDGISQIGQYQIVAINRGSMHGLEAGHVLSIFQRGRRVKDPVASGMVELPQQLAGTLMVFKVDKRLSYGLVMSAARPLHVLDKVDKPRPSSP